MRKTVGHNNQDFYIIFPLLLEGEGDYNISQSLSFSMLGSLGAKLFQFHSHILFELLGCYNTFCCPLWREADTLCCPEAVERG